MWTLLRVWTGSRCISIICVNSNLYAVFYTTQNLCLGQRTFDDVPAESVYPLVNYSAENLPNTCLGLQLNKIDPGHHPNLGLRLTQTAHRMKFVLIHDVF